MCSKSLRSSQSTNTDEILLDIDLGEQLFRVNDLCYVGKSFVCAGLNNGGVCVMRVAEDGSDEVRASMVIEGSQSGKDTKERIKRVEYLEGGSGYLVIGCCSNGVISVWDFEGAVNGLMDEDEDDDEEDDDEDSDDDFSDDNEGYVLLQQVKLGTGSRVVSVSGWSSESGDLLKDEFQNKGDYGDDEDAGEGSSSDVGTKVKKKKKEEKTEEPPNKKRRNAVDATNIMEDADAVKRARDLIKKSKEITKKGSKKIAKQKNKKKT